MQIKSLFLLALALGLFVGYVDWHSEEVQLPALLVLLFAFLLSLAQPKTAWLWALIVGSCIPLVHFIGRRLGYAPLYPIQPNLLAAFIALIPAFIGAYSGALVRYLTSYAHKQSS